MPTARSTTGLPPGVQVGPTSPRLLSAVIEVGPVWLLTGLAAVFAFLLDGLVLVAVLCGLLALAWAVLIWTQRAGKAAGPGMRAGGLQLVGFHDGRPIGWARVLVRWLVFTGLTISVVGLIAMLVVMHRQPRRQGWHDLAADSVVIKERPLAPPRSQSALARTGAPRPAGSRPVTASPSPATATVPAAAPASTGAGPAPASAPAGHAGSEPSSSPALAAEEDAEQPLPDPTAELVWWLRLDDGRDVGVDGLVLLGRNPQPRVGEEDATLIKVTDEGRTVSKSHLAVGVDAGGLYVMDRGSTNGTTVTAPDGGQRPCPPGDLIDVSAGSVISFGDHWLEVRRPGQS